jgi:UDP-N-acetyl-D-mannosaminuronic acid dehydrogenase
MYHVRFTNNRYTVKLDLPSTGVGWHCIPVYPWFQLKEMEKWELFGHPRLLRTARELNDEMIAYFAEKIILHCLQINNPLPDSQDTRA